MPHFLTSHMQHIRKPFQLYPQNTSRTCLLSPPPLLPFWSGHHGLLMQLWPQPLIWSPFTACAPLQSILLHNSQRDAVETKVRSYRSSAQIPSIAPHHILNKSHTLGVVLHYFSDFISDPSPPPSISCRQKGFLDVS